MSAVAASIESLRNGVLSYLDEHFARAMGRIAGERRPEVLLAAALASRFVRNGHVCLDLPRFLAAPALVEEGEATTAVSWPSLQPWLEMLRESPLVTTADAGGEPRPLVLDASGRLYLKRYWDHEAEVVAAIQRRVAHSDPIDDRQWLRGALDRLFPRGAESAAGGPDWQRIAAVVALQRFFCVISGGPGTGKTFTVVKILALMIERALRHNDAPPRVTLVAPTGKAAARLSQSIRRAKGDLNVEAPVLALIPDDAATIHRCLGTFRGSATRVRHDRDNPLNADVVLVDEASMVDLGLLRRLLDAVGSRTRVILLGDKDQLASVEAGAVLGDICNSGRAVTYSQPWREHLIGLTDEPLPATESAPAETGIWDCIVQLKYSYRSEKAPAIAALAAAINAGDTAEAMRLLESGDVPYVGWHAPAEKRGLTAALRREIAEGFAGYLRPASFDERLRRLDQFRLLCAHRRGPRGVEAMNPFAEQALADAGLIEPEGAAYVGRPILVTQNDYQLNLFNGDVGIVVQDPEAPEKRLVLFDAEEGKPRTLSPARLPAHETAYAMSVHKSQGSEFDRVAVILPLEVSPVLSRELLYTAVTRARGAVTLHGSREIIEQAIGRRIERASGLRDALWQESGAAPV